MSSLSVSVNYTLTFRNGNSNSCSQLTFSLHLKELLDETATDLVAIIRVSNPGCSAVRGLQVQQFGSTIILPTTHHRPVHSSYRVLYVELRTSWRTAAGWRLVVTLSHMGSG